MDEITNNTSWYNTASTSDGSSNITFTTATDVSNTWFPYYQESTWLPYHYKPYKPEWHIKLGYKKQLSSMWDD